MRATAPKTGKKSLEIRAFSVGGITWIVNGSCFAAIGGSCRCDLRHSKGAGGGSKLDYEELPTRKDKGATQMELPTLPTIENSIYDQAHTCG
jgi:hypothetical protein